MRCVLFADANVLLDDLLNRMPAATECKQIFLLAENGELALYTSASCFLKVLYFLKKSGLPNVAIIQIAEQLLKIYKLAPSDERIIMAGLHSGFKILEDGIQYNAALAINGITHFITSNIKDFKGAFPHLPVLSPAQFILLYNSTVT